MWVCGCVCADDVGELLLGEMKLQQFLKENPLKQNSSPRTACPPLTEARSHLTGALQRGNLRVSLSGTIGAVHYGYCPSDVMHFVHFDLQCLVNLV